jgi:hypothetical protein
MTNILFPICLLNSCGIGCRAMELNQKRCKHCIQAGNFDVDGDGNLIQPATWAEVESRRVRGEVLGKEYGRLIMSLAPFVNSGS